MFPPPSSTPKRAASVATAIAVMAAAFILPLNLPLRADQPAQAGTSSQLSAPVAAAFETAGTEIKAGRYDAAVKLLTDALAVAHAPGEQTRVEFAIGYVRLP